MGEKFIRRLPSMTDQELVGTRPWILNKKSQEALAAEIRKRGVSAYKRDQDEGKRRHVVNVIIGVAGLVLTLAAIVVAILALD